MSPVTQLWCLFSRKKEVVEQQRGLLKTKKKLRKKCTLSLGGINAQKVGHLASEIGVGIPKKSNEIFCGSSSSGTSAAEEPRQNATSREAFFSLPYHYFVVAKVVRASLAGASAAAFSRLFRAQKLLSAFAAWHIWIANEEEASSYAKLGPIVTLSNLQWLQVPKSTAAALRQPLQAKLFPSFLAASTPEQKVSLAWN